MNRPAPATPRRQYGLAGSRGWIAALAVAGVVLVNAVVFGLVWRRDAPAPPAAPATGSTAVPGVPRSATDRWLVDVNEAGLGLRARTGECVAATGFVEQTTDGGATWTPVGLPSLVAIYALDAGGGVDTPSIIGATADCQPHQWRTPDGGRTWKAVEGTPGAWFLDTDGTTGVYAPGRQIPLPCPADAAVVDVRSGPAGAGIALCGDGAVLRSTDDGDQWREFGRVAGASSVFFSGDTGHAAATTPDCRGVAVLEGGSAGWAPLSCVQGAEANGAGVAVRGDRGLLVTFSGTWTTKDGGRTWAPV